MMMFIFIKTEVLEGRKHFLLRFYDYLSRKFEVVKIITHAYNIYT